MIERSDADLCPGEDDCTRLKIDATACEGCPSEPVWVDSWTRHILELGILVQAGWRFSLDEVTVHECFGLKVLTEERNRFYNKKARQPNG